MMAPILQVGTKPASSLAGKTIDHGMDQYVKEQEDTTHISDIGRGLNASLSRRPHVACGIVLLVKGSGLLAQKDIGFRSRFLATAAVASNSATCPKCPRYSRQ